MGGEMLASLREKHSALLRALEDGRRARRRGGRDVACVVQAELWAEVLRGDGVRGFRAGKDERGEDEGRREWCDRGSDVDGVIREWVEDYGAVFRMCKKHRFDEGEVMAAAERTLRWRAQVLKPLLETRTRTRQTFHQPQSPLQPRRTPQPLAHSQTKNQPQPPPQPPPPPSSSFIQCLPDAVHDVFRRPVLLVCLGALFSGGNVGSSLDTRSGVSASDASAVDAAAAIKREIVYAHEEMRRRLAAVQSTFVESVAASAVAAMDPAPIVLQCVMILDAKDAVLYRHGTAVELIPWFLREVAPHYPGMCAAIFVVNHSWGYGIYNLAKRLLPANVISRIHFPSVGELLECFDKNRLPRDYGGDFDVTLSLPDPSGVNFDFDALTRWSSTESTEMVTTDGENESHPSDLRRGESAQPQDNRAPHRYLLSSTSSLNPYFGYPAVASPGSVPYLRNGRRRKRDLARTLVKMWIAKLRRLAGKTWTWIILTVVLWALGRHKGSRK